MARDLAADTAVTRLARRAGLVHGQPAAGVELPHAVGRRADDRRHARHAGGARRPRASADLGQHALLLAGARRTARGARRGAAPRQRRGAGARALSSTTMPGPGLEVSATFGRDRDGIDLIDAEPPDCRRPKAPPTSQPIGPDASRLPAALLRELRLAVWRSAQPWWTARLDSRAGAHRRAGSATACPQRLADGRLDPLAIPPIADTMPPALIQKLGPSPSRSSRRAST